MVSLKGTESSLCSVILLSSCWHVSRVFNTWYHFVWVFYDNTNLHPACCLMGTSVSANSPAFCTPCFQSRSSSRCKMNNSCFSFQSSSAGLLCQPKSPLQHEPTLVSVAGLSWLHQDCKARRARYGSLTTHLNGSSWWLPPEREQTVRNIWVTQGVYSQGPHPQTEGPVH